MDTAQLKKFAQQARRMLMEQIAARLSFVLEAESSARRETPQSVKDLEKQIAESSKESVIEKTAYIWFNRFCALRFMDVNRYTRIGTVSPAEGFTQPEILMEAKQGHIDDGFSIDKGKVFDLLNGIIPSQVPQQEAYRMLLVSACNHYNRIMPFLFERISDYTELLMPDDLLSESSILSLTIEALSPEACENVEVIGWLYQFYISEKKDEVFDGLKKNKKITPENIPAATQLFTPNWIVRYLVENSLGRLWMLNKPGSRLVERMEYYIRPEQPESEFLKIGSPEEIKICDPACGSGHMLVYAFDILYSIYEEEGYDANEIPRLILENNLYGIEIDERAGELAAFALTMKAREKYRRFFNKPVQPNICVLENIQFKENELKNYMDEMGHDLFTSSFQATLRQFEEADNFGSLIRPAMKDAAHIHSLIKEKNLSDQMFLHPIHKKVIKVLKQADYLTPKYHILITNPPYMNSIGFNVRLKDYSKKKYTAGNTDLYGCFIEICIVLLRPLGFSGLITIPNWMFLPSFSTLRTFIFETSSIVSLIHYGRGVWGSDFGSCSFVLKKGVLGEWGQFKRLFCSQGEVNSNGILIQRFHDHKKFPIKVASSSDFKMIPNKPIAYAISAQAKKTFLLPHLGSIARSGGRCKTSNDELYLRFIWEINKRNVGLDGSWCPMFKGGEFRRYYGNIYHVMRWDNTAKNYYKTVGGLTREEFWDIPGLTWTIVTANANASFRLKKNSAQYNSVSPTIFFDSEDDLIVFLGLLNTKAVNYLLQTMNPTLALNVGDVLNLPVPNLQTMTSTLITHNKRLMAIAQKDWESFEFAFEFLNLPILQPLYRQQTLKETYKKLFKYLQQMTIEMQRLEEENNRIAIDAYGLKDELTPEVPLKEITLTCNPHYRYGGDKTEEELEALLLADTMRDYISYAVGCMLGRYSIDKPGLILANQGETVNDYLAQIPEPSFEPDEDNVIPILDEGWFSDDITERFKKFLKVTFGEENYEINLKFIEDAIGKDIRKYFLKDFYSDHVKRYKKRPIYWLFSSPKGSFNALIYMHRYQPDTASIVLNEYLREFRAKLSARKEHQEAISISSSASQKEKTQALKDIEKLKKTIEELDEYEREILYPLATRQISIDLDDGVKVNYLKFGAALKKIPGLEATED